MVINSSALLALLFGEPEADRLARAIASASTRFVGAPGLVECSAVLMARKGLSADVILDAWLRKIDAEVVSLTPEFARTDVSAAAY